MPELGEVQRGNAVGFKLNASYIYIACPTCKKQRWVQLRKGNRPRAIFCRVCANTGKYMPKGKDHWCWKGGRKKQQGYIFIWVDESAPFYNMAVQGYGAIRYIPEHRLVMAQHLGRCLLRSESVHHKNGIKDDNRIENLELISPANHMIRTKLCSQCDLRKEIKLLKWQVKELNKTLQLKLNATIATNLEV